MRVLPKGVEPRVPRKKKNYIIAVNLYITGTSRSKISVYFI